VRARQPGIIAFYLAGHAPGYGIPVGGVVVTEDIVIQAGGGCEHLLRRDLPAVPALHERRCGLGPATAVDRRGGDAHAAGVGSHRRSTAALQREEGRGSSASGEDLDGPPRSERQYIPVDDSFLDSDRVTRARDKAAAARLRRRRQSLRRDAGRRERRIRVGDDPLRQPRLWLANGESLLLRRRRLAVCQNSARTRGCAPTSRSAASTGRITRGELHVANRHIIVHGVLSARECLTPR
jgi:hypothetical protein